MVRPLITYVLLLLSLTGFGQFEVRDAPWYAGRKEAHAVHFDASGRIWIATANELFVDDGRTCVPLNIPNTDVQFQFGGIYITTIRPDPDGIHLWVTSWGGGVFRINTSSGAIRHWRFDPEKPEGIKSDWTWDVVFIEEKAVICSHYDGLQVLDPETETFEFLLDGSDTLLPQIGKVRSLQRDLSDPGLYWAATDNGLKKYYPDRDSVVPLPVSPGALREVDREYPIHNFFYVDQDEVGTVWLGTLDFGLMSYNPGLDEWQQYPINPVTGRDSETENFVHDIAISDDYIAVAAARSGLTLFNRRTRRFEHPEETFVRNDHAMRCFDVLWHKGSVYAPRPKGCVQVDFGPQEAASQEQPFLKNIRIKRQNLEYTSELFVPQNLSLSYGDSLELEIGATQLFAGQIAVDYRWRSEDEWLPVRPFETEIFAFEASGEYALEVRYRWNDQEWLEPVVLMELTMDRPLWTYWQPYLVLGLVLLLIALWFIGRIRRSRRKQEMLQEQFSRRIAEVQMTALRSQMNPHFLFNSLNSIKDFIVSNKPKDAVRYLQKFSELIRAILENSKEKTITLEKEIETVKLYAELEALRYNGKFDLIVSVDPGLELNQIQVAPLIIQPYVENAIWHGLIPKEGKGEIHIRCAEDEGFVRIEIEDNGIGRAASMKRKSSSVIKRKSMGMSITRERIELSDTSSNGKSVLNIEDLHDAEGRAIGTRITILWKMNQPIISQP